MNVNSQKYLVIEEEERPTQKTQEPTKIKPKGIKMVKMIVKPIKSLGEQESWVERNKLGGIPEDIEDKTHHKETRLGTVR